MPHSKVYRMPILSLDIRIMTTQQELLIAFSQAVRSLHPGAESVRFPTWPAAPAGHLFSTAGVIYGQGDECLGSSSDIQSKTVAELAVSLSQDSNRNAKFLDWSMNDAGGDAVVVHLVDRDALR